MLKKAKMNYDYCECCGTCEGDCFDCPYCGEMLTLYDLDIEEGVDYKGKKACIECGKKFILEVNVSSLG